MTNEEAIKIIREAIDVIKRQEVKIEILKDYSKDLIAEISNLKSSATIKDVENIKKKEKKYG